jgi:acyl-CoA synthetase (AMP-forming)/AMP-acid ligase II
MQIYQTIEDMLLKQRQDAICLDVPYDADQGKSIALSYHNLSDQINHTRQQLNELSIGRGDRVAIVLPNCPEMATVFVSVASTCTAAPLNMAYTATDFEFYLVDIRASAVVIGRSNGNPVAADVAKRLGIQILWLETRNELGIGRYDLVSDSLAGVPKHTGPALSEDIALILHTSGTTSRPKIVPLLHRNVVASANHIRQSLQLSQIDRGLHVMPMFHIHGLIAALLAPWAAGGAVIVTPGFNALKFFSWIDSTKPSWYTAVPTMHQALLIRADKGDNATIIKNNPLRFIRSSSSSIPTQVIADLEQVFNTPLIEAYGMTEAAHQMCSNPLPPAERRPGSVGLAAGPEVAIMDDDGKLIGTDRIGEVVIRGDNVTPGYENNPEANSKAFTTGWFRTGDQGSLSADGYLTLTGRLKEIINRGGEKISPLKIDEALMDHSAIQQVVTFAMPHEMLGEAVAAVVVLKEGMEATEDEIKKFLMKKLSKFEVPEKIVFMAEIPKGATGKLQRIGLWDKLVSSGAVS